MLTSPALLLTWRPSSSKGQIAPSDGVSVERLGEFRLGTNESLLHEDQGIDVVTNLSWEAKEIETLIVSNCWCRCGLAVHN